MAFGGPQPPERPRRIASRALRDRHPRARPARARIGRDMHGAGEVRRVDPVRHDEIAVIAGCAPLPGVVRADVTEVAGAGVDRVVRPDPLQAGGSPQDRGERRDASRDHRKRAEQRQARERADVVAAGAGASGRRSGACAGKPTGRCRFPLPPHDRSPSARCLISRAGQGRSVEDRVDVDTAGPAVGIGVVVQRAPPLVGMHRPERVSSASKINDERASQPATTRPGSASGDGRNGIWCAGPARPGRPAQSREFMAPSAPAVYVGNP